ncbi:hypothetical protein NP233_g12682 [Leucocoprinus birnbaumii]|uniref:Flavin-containing monooxygenase n=1 Tax=Leucocoprinus birnbaumii TaxID=56174 RepID=A0AAD5VE67_9AGAR|nr:hypothetical protein NP233_g12682 [Leucocoprinus birnbaumii]
MLLSPPAFVLSLLSYLLPSDWRLTTSELAPKPQQEKSILIIGAGSAGLGALKTAVDISKEDNLNWKIVLFEEREDVGGVWLPDSRTSPPELPKTPLYPYLRTNTPVPFMTYPSFVFPPGTPLYPHHDHVLKYHQTYADAHNLWPYIRFNHSVLNAAWIPSDTATSASMIRGAGRFVKRGATAKQSQWNITFQPGLDSRAEKFALFDHLVVASGNHHIPNVVHWRGEDEWLAHGHDRAIKHAIRYRYPEDYTGKKVLFVGAGDSSFDIAKQVVQFADKVYISVRHEVAPLPGTELRADISHFSTDAIHFVDGTALQDVDIVILGTGYQIRKQFLESSALVKIDPTANSSAFRSAEHLTSNTKYLFPLYKHIFPILEELPITALAFIGIPMNIPNCPSDVAQSMFALQVIKHGDGVLPGKTELLEELDEQEEGVRRGGFDPYVRGHRLIRGTEMDYQDDLVEFLKKKGLIRDDGRRFVEKWRRDVPSPGACPKPRLVLPYIPSTTREFFSSMPPNVKPSIRKEEWEKRLREVKVTKDVGIDDVPTVDRDLNRLIMDYLVIEGYKSAAEEFSQEADLTPPVDFESIESRMDIREALQRGDVEDAITRVNELNPEVSNQVCLQTGEYTRTGKD